MRLSRLHHCGHCDPGKRIRRIVAVCASFVLHASLLILANHEPPALLPSQETPAVLFIDFETVLAEPEHARHDIRPDTTVQEAILQATSPSRDRLLKQGEKALPTQAENRASKHKAAPPPLNARTRAPSIAPATGTSAAPSAVPPSWRSALLLHLNKHKRYPLKARQNRQTGVAILQFTMDRSGKVMNYHLLKRTGIDILDQETLAMIKHASPLPPIPPDVASPNLTLTVPVRFDLH